MKVAALCFVFSFYLSDQSYGKRIPQVCKVGLML